MINISFNKEDHIEYEPFNLILRSVEVPDGLSEKVLEAMTQKRKEIEEIQKEKQEKKAAHKSVALRAAVIAAVITLMILIIPSSRQVVVSAAESAWHSVIEWVHDWVDLFGTNPLFDDTHDGFHPYTAELDNASVITEEIHSDVIDLSGFDFTNYPKSVNVKITADDFEFTIGEMQLADYEIVENYYDVTFTNQNKGLVKMVYTDDWENYKGGTCQFPDVYLSSLSDASTVELAFLKDNKKLFKAKYNVSDGYGTYTGISSGDLYFGELTWVQPKYEYLFDGAYEDVDDVRALNDILLQLKPDQIEVASVSMIVEAQTDYIKTDSPDKAEELKNEGYICEEYYDEKENLRFEAYKLKAKIIKGYNPKYYDLQAEAEKNEVILEEFNSYIDSSN